MKTALTMFACLGLAGCATAIIKNTPVYTVSADKIDRIMTLKVQHRAASIGLGIIKAGELVWTGYYGEQSPGVPTSASTMFNTASVNKVVTTETLLRLAAKEFVSLDEPIHRFYVYPGLSADARFKKLTPRIILTHKTGFLNWPHDYDDGKLAFVNEPGEVYGYSGAGFMILANFMQNKLEKPYPQIVREEIFTPIDMLNASIVQERWMDSRVTQPLLSDGSFDAAYQLDYGYWNSADDLFVTVEDYAKFLVSVMNVDNISPALATERIRVQSDLSNDEIWACTDGAADLCPSPYGHGLGWFVFGYDGNLNVQHGGNDISEAAIGYFDTATHDGMIVFVNAPTPEGVLLWPKIVDILDEEVKFTSVFHHIIGKFFGKSEN